jgi:hypothetical protein
MSIGASMLALYSFLRNEGALDGVNTVADIGSIEYEMKFPEPVNSFAKHMPTPPKYDFGFKVDFATLESRRLTMKQVMADESLGMLAEGGPEGPRAKILMMENELRRRLQSPKWAVRDGIRGIAGLMRRAASRL